MKRNSKQNITKDSFIMKFTINTTSELKSILGSKDYSILCSDTPSKPLTCKDNFDFENCFISNPKKGFPNKGNPSSHHHGNSNYKGNKYNKNFRSRDQYDNYHKEEISDLNDLRKETELKIKSFEISQQLSFIFSENKFHDLLNNVHLMAYSEVKPIGETKDNTPEKSDILEDLQMINKYLNYPVDIPLWYLYHQEAKSSFGPCSTQMMINLFNNKSINEKSMVRFIDVLNLKGKSDFEFFQLSDISVKGFCKEITLSHMSKQAVEFN